MMACPGFFRENAEETAVLWYYTGQETADAPVRHIPAGTDGDVNGLW